MLHRYNYAYIIILAQFSKGQETGEGTLFVKTWSEPMCRLRILMQWKAGTSLPYLPFACVTLLVKTCFIYRPNDKKLRFVHFFHSHCGCPQIYSKQRPLLWPQVLIRTPSLSRRDWFIYRYICKQTCRGNSGCYVIISSLYRCLYAYEPLQQFMAMTDLWRVA